MIFVGRSSTVGWASWAVRLCIFCGCEATCTCMQAGETAVWAYPGYSTSYVMYTLAVCAVWLRSLLLQCCKGRVSRTFWPTCLHLPSWSSYVSLCLCRSCVERGVFEWANQIRSWGWRGKMAAWPAVFGCSHSPEDHLWVSPATRLWTVSMTLYWLRVHGHWDHWDLHSVAWQIAKECHPSEFHDRFLSVSLMSLPSYYVNRDTLFSYHTASEEFLHRVMALYVASHYKVRVSAQCGVVLQLLMYSIAWHAITLNTCDVYICTYVCDVPVYNGACIRRPPL